MARRPPTIGEIEDAAAASTREAKRAVILRALRENAGNRTRAALAAGYSSPTNLRRAARRVGIDIDAIDAPQPEDIGGERLTDAEREARAKPKRKPAPKTKAAARRQKGRTK